MGSPATSTVGVLLRQHRMAARLTQEQLARRGGYSTDYVSKIERGDRIPPVEALDRLVVVLGLDASERDRLHAARAAGEGALDVAPGSMGLRTGPAQVTSFVGREAELDALVALLDEPEVRLVTLTGPGGIGKTRLVLRLCDQVDGRRVDGHPVGGPWFVPLAGVVDPGHVAPAVAAALEVAEAPGVPLVDALVRRVGERPGLLVLDNFEQVLGAAPTVADLVARCPRLQVVVTSRAALPLSGERRFEVPPLSTPPPDGAAATTGERDADVGAVGRHAAVRLFVERARAVRPGFALDDTNADDVAAICRAVDGLPLALELAAARVRLFPPRALRHRLSSRLGLLSGGPVDRPPRHRALRATIDWSVDLLSPDERRLFARLGVFAGGATVEAVEAVAGDGLDAVDLLTSLVDKSLVQHGGDDEPRVWLLETIREYAAEQLVTLGEDRALRRRHAAHYAEVVGGLAPGDTTADQDAARRTLDLELDNVRAALATFLLEGRVEEELTLAAGVASYLVSHCRGAEAGEWLDRGLAAGVDVGDAVRGRAFLALGEVATEQGHLDRASASLDAALAVCRALGDEAGVGRTLNRAAVVAYRQGDYDRAVDLAGGALDRATALGDGRERAYALVTLGTVATHRGEHETARARLAEAVELNRTAGGRDAMAHALINLGYDLTLQGRLDEATAIFEELLETGRAAGLRRHVAYAHENLGNIAALAGRYDRAAEHLHQGMGLARELSDQHLLLYLASDLVKLTSAQGRWESAARLGGAVAGIRARSGMSMAPAEDEARAAALAPARRALGDGPYDAAHAEGAALTLDEAMAYASAVASS